MKSSDLKILVTGGAGYIGSHTVRRLKKAGYTTIILDNLVFGHREFVDPTELVVGDLSNIALLNKVFSENKIDAVIHFAAYAYVGESVQNPSKYYHNNVGCTLSLLDAMVAHNVKKFVFSSTRCRRK